MSLHYTILGFLSFGPMSGYEIKKAIDKSTQYFWHAELSQIYPTLRKLESTRQVKVEVIPQEGKPDKKIYTITQSGQNSLTAWLSEPLDEIPPTKSPLLLKLFFMGVLDRNEVISQMRCQIEIQRARLKRYQQESKKDIQEAVTSSDLTQSGLLWELIRQYGEQQTQTSIQWLENAIQVIEGKNENSGN